MADEEAWDRISRSVMREIVEAVRDTQGRGSQRTRQRRKYPAVVNRPILLGKPDYDISKGDAGDVALYDGDEPDTVSETGMMIEAYARLGDVDAGKWVYVYKFPWGNEVVNAEC